jgi:hypothetical protein
VSLTTVARRARRPFFFLAPSSQDFKQISKLVLPTFSALVSCQFLLFFTTNAPCWMKREGSRLCIFEPCPTSMSLHRSFLSSNDVAMVFALNKQGGPSRSRCKGTCPAGEDAEPKKKRAKTRKGATAKTQTKQEAAQAPSHRSARLQNQPIQSPPLPYPPSSVTAHSHFPLLIFV